jgi:hypothetical protein
MRVIRVLFGILLALVCLVLILFGVTQMANPGVRDDGGGAFALIVWVVALLLAWASWRLLRPQPAKPINNPWTKVWDEGSQSWVLRRPVSVPADTDGAADE